MYFHVLLIMKSSISDMFPNLALTSLFLILSSWTCFHLIPRIMCIAEWWKYWCFEWFFPLGSMILSPIVACWGDDQRERERCLLSGTMILSVWGIWSVWQIGCCSMMNIYSESSSSLFASFREAGKYIASVLDVLLTWYWHAFIGKFCYVAVELLSCIFKVILCREEKTSIINIKQVVDE